MRERTPIRRASQSVGQSCNEAGLRRRFHLRAPLRHRHHQLRSAIPPHFETLSPISATRQSGDAGPLPDNRLLSHTKLGQRPSFMQNIRHKDLSKSAQHGCSSKVQDDSQNRRDSAGSMDSVCATGMDSARTRIRHCGTFLRGIHHNHLTNYAFAAELMLRR